MIIDIADYLEHHGVKGMQWGVVNEDDQGRLREAFKSFTDKQKYGSMNDKEEKIEDQGFFQSLTPAQKKAAVVFGGAVVVAGLAYGTNRYNLNTKGTIDPRTLLDGNPFDNLGGAHKEGLNAYLRNGIELPAGSLVARVSKDIETNIRPGGFYAAHEYHDIQSYTSFLGTIGGHTNYFKATTAVKAPSTEEYVRLLGRAMDTPEVLKARDINVKLFAKMAGVDKEKVLTKLAAEELSRRDFAFSLNHSTVSGLLPSRFVKEVLGAGYTSVIDYNNANGGLAQAPLRHLDGKMFKFFSSEEITSEVKQLLKVNSDSYMDRIGDFYDTVKHIAHHGVKGQKWGVRRQRKKLAKKNTKAFLKDIRTRANDVRVPLTKEEYESLPSKPVKLGGAGALYTRVAASANPKLRDVAYVTTNSKDHTRYVAVLMPEGTYTNNKFELKIKAAKALTSPSEKERVDLFIQTLSQQVPSRDGKSTVVGKEALKGYPFFIQKSKINALNDRELGIETYKRFAQAQVLRTPLHTAYFDNIKKSGYNALVDDADRGYLSDLPVIIFPKEAGARVVSAKAISKEELVERRIAVELLSV